MTTLFFAIHSLPSAVAMINEISYYARRGLQLAKEEELGVLFHDAINEFSPDESGRLESVVSDDLSLSWLAGDGPIIVRDLSTDYDDFYTVFNRDRPTEFYVSSDRPFESLEFDVVGRSNASVFTVTAELETESGESIVERRHFDGISDRWDDHGPEAISLSGEQPLRSATVRIDSSPDPGSGIRDSIYALRNRRKETVEGPRVSLPALRSDKGVDRTPIVLVTVDTFRYDCLDCFDDLLTELGDDALVPDQPRTQAPETKSVHGSMFTGTYPGDHGYVKRGGREYLRPMNPSLTTLGELLAERRYKCSGLVSHSNLTADRGFARGFHRYQLRDMDWEARPYDAGTNVDTCLRWLDQDLHSGDQALFYFLHLFDAHVPYFPPSPMLFSEEVDQSLVEELKERNRMAGTPPGSPVDYLRLLRGDENPGDGFDTTPIERWYRQSLEFVSSQLARLIREMKALDIYDDALIIVVGDHGEEFFERKFALHQTLYDATIRPGAIVKPPVDSDIVVPDDMEIIDILPTVANLAGAEVPEQCSGTVWNGQRHSSPRIAERIWPDWYCIAAETDGTKGIFTFENDFPNRPTERQRESGPVEVEFYDIDAVQNGDFSEVSPDESVREELHEAVLEVMEADVEATDRRVARVDDETLDRLEELGYR